MAETEQRPALIDYADLNAEHLRPLPHGKLGAHSGRWEVAPGVVPHELAIKAGQAALEITRRAASLPYAHQQNIGTRLHTQIGIFDPEQNPMARTYTIFNYARSLTWAASLIDVIGEMHMVWPQLRTATHAWLDAYQMDDHIPLHPDNYYQDRAIVELNGGSVILLNDRKIDGDFVRAQAPGDAYMLHCTENEKWSPVHEVEIPIPRLALRLAVRTEHRHGVLKG